MDLIEKVAGRSVDEVAEKAKDWALLHGFTMCPRGSLPGHAEIVPFSLLPSRFPRASYEEALAAQPLVNELTLRVARDGEFLRAALGPVAQVDEFTRRLLEVHAAAGDSQQVSLGLLRADYMLDREPEDGSSLKQVEVNTIASGQGWLGAVCSRLHRYVLEEMDLMDGVVMIDNNPLHGLCCGMIMAWRRYRNPSAAILFVIEENPIHVADQRYHEYRLRELEPSVRVLRLTLTEVGLRGRLSQPGSRLLLDDREIGLVYLRSGYAPEQYGTEAEWAARLLIERSAAIKCPSIGCQLAGTKRVQQLLAQPGCLERYLGSEDSRSLRRHFAGLYSLDPSEAGDTALELGLARPEDFVLKPQREGGSNNLFGEALRSKLAALAGSEERPAWILMRRIKPAAQRNYLVRASGSPRLADVNSELGVFGIVLADGDRIVANETVGHTLRTKLAEVDEAGVSSGYGACDSPLLV